MKLRFYFTLIKTFGIHIYVIIIQVRRIKIITNYDNVPWRYYKIKRTVRQLTWSLHSWSPTRLFRDDLVTLLSLLSLKSVFQKSISLAQLYLDVQMMDYLFQNRYQKVFMYVPPNISKSTLYFILSQDCVTIAHSL